MQSLRAQLVACFLGVCLLLALLLGVGNELMRRAQLHFEEGLAAHVQPLERLSRLQSRMANIRVVEVELPRLTDVFAVTARLDSLGAELKALDHDLSAYLAALPVGLHAESTGLAEQWQRYRQDLERVTRHAAAMEMEQVALISGFDSIGRWHAISAQLKSMAGRTEKMAAEMVSQAVEEQAQFRRAFVWACIGGLTLLAVTLIVFARSVNSRLRRLHQAATTLAQGHGGSPLRWSGTDELADVGTAFDAMRDQVQARERALRQAQDELESRVAERTRELHEANSQLKQEIRDRRRAQAELHHQARFDGLTNLPNRTLAMSRLAQGLQQAARQRSSLAVAFVDLDDFKKVNDTLGHSSGDALLIEAARRLTLTMRNADTVARLGGDEFLLLIPGLRAAEDAAHVAQKIINAFADPFQLDTHEVVVTASVGLALYPEDGIEPQTLLRNADLAMYEAKARGRNSYHFYDKALNERSTERLALERRLREALHRREFELHFQPVLDADTQILSAAEALIRWSDQGVPVPPDRFIPVAEHAGLIGALGDWVIDAACAQLAAWGPRLSRDFRLAINVSAGQFRGDALVKHLAESMARHGVRGHQLQIEVTESVLLRSDRETMETLHALHRMGVELALDDFGTGYSSLSYLKRFPFHALKIDRQFVRDLAVDNDDRALVAATIALGRSLELTVIAEGVETAEQLELLRAERCHRVQGWLFDRALPAHDFEARWLRPRLVPVAVGEPG